MRHIQSIHVNNGMTIVDGRVKSHDWLCYGIARYLDYQGICGMQFRSLSRDKKALNQTIYIYDHDKATLSELLYTILNGFQRREVVPRQNMISLLLYPCLQFRRTAT